MKVNIIKGPNFKYAEAEAYRYLSKLVTETMKEKKDDQKSA